MYDILLLSHGDLAEGFYRTMEMILGERPHMTWLSLYSGEANEALEKKLDAEVAKGQDRPLLVLADLYSGSPCRSAIARLLNKERSCHIIAGMNLPMVMEAYAMRHAEMETCIAALVQGSRMNIVDVNETIVQNACEDEENE